jgi:hypothetical protein
MVWRIDAGGTVPTLPTIPAAGTEAFYSGGNQATGTPATIVPAWWMNMVQEEIRNVVVAAGISPNKNDNAQLLAAISGITGGNIYLPLAGGTMTGVIAFSLPVGPPDPMTSGELLSLRGGGAGNPDYAIGINTNEFWFGTPLPTNHFTFYGGMQINARIPPNGSPPVQPYDLMTLGYWHSVVRPPLTANGNFYIDAALGSDTTGDGSSGNPWTTLQYAYNWIQANVNFAGYQCNIHMADGIYTGGLVAAGSFIGANNAGSLLILGNSSDPTAVVIHTTGADCVDVSAGGSISLKHLTVVSTTSGGAGGDGVTASYTGELFLYDMNFGACSGNQMYAAGGGSVIVMTDYQITGGAQVHAQAAQQGYIEMSSTPARHIAIALVGNPNFSAGFVMAGDGGIYASNNVFTGSATGPRYDAHLNGVIFTNGKGANYFPGSVAGGVSTGGQYG